MSLSLRIASENDLSDLLPFVARFHDLELIQQTDSQRQQSLLPLLCNQSLGIIWLIFEANHLVGYIAICFSYSIEFGGRDAMIDEFFIDEKYRHQGLGTQVLNDVATLLTEQGIKAISLEVSRSNKMTQRFYSRCEFELREHYILMTRILKTE